MSESKRLFEEAQRVLVGGVNSPVRAAIRPYPFFVREGKGPYLITVDGNRLIDYVLGYGPLILGHAPEAVTRRIVEYVSKGWLYGAPTELEITLAKKIVNHFPSIEMVRFVNSGGEAVATAIRLARGYTGRRKILKFEGCYHGAVDSVLVKAGSAAAHFGSPSSAGVPEDVAKLTLVARYNDLDSVEKIMREEGNDVAAIIVEPIMANYGVIPPRNDFLKGLREVADRFGSLLIFDEVVTGYRLGLGGAQRYYGVKADITTLGKIIGGGFPVGAVGAREEIMSKLSPKGPVFNAGTFNGHPISMIAGLATIEVLETTNAYEIAINASRKLAEGLDDVLGRYGIDHTINWVPTMLQVFFTKGEVIDHETASRSNAKIYLNLHEELLKRGVFIAPSQFEAIFTSAAHEDSIINETLRQIEDSMKAMVLNKVN
ncbi:glutamate-1-semialdehyde-2,1-aminomutase [Vulcanisaeta sp. EB80]|jgi:glutamate-1-semialdehyde 2,1-aminomutase|uniref:glutamate-1-semialdehyde 2,1-aminomutase n=1 Tax=Vulcanisaeta sp. EB80 TaxID=1650660 RepID=UPI00074B0DDC|nr:glutamate-1-semialdehyde 2,1-aminomutase [Vulcanisaeta sp. EB80]KUO82994.1 MAG: glutamate-1-semialdehyde aminotransferase [Vulcanisaeta sp. OSP_8]MDT7970728.1 glutamate-1-semialdehyde 2,1-aminomutase [Vulcanisaeta sp.]PLC67872.1 glutamate-1-semialdehyde-2,1-aminomutase [Vulcanisaeta sp. EB80]